LSVETKVNKLEVKEATEIANFYGVPQSLVNLFWLNFGGTAYPKAAFHLYLAHRKGVQRIRVEVRDADGQGHWEAEAWIYPAVTSRMLESLVKLDPEERKKMIAYLTEPTWNSAKASKDNVRSSLMQPYLKEMAVTRAVARAARLFAGGSTAFEELPEGEMNQEEIKKAAEMARPVEAATASEVAPEAQPSRQGSGGKVTKEMVDFLLAKDIQAGTVKTEAAVSGEIFVSLLKDISQGEYGGIDNLLKDYRGSFNGKTKTWNIPAP